MASKVIQVVIIWSKIQYFYSYSFYNGRYNIEPRPNFSPIFFAK